MQQSVLHFILNLFTALGYGGIVLAMAIESCNIPLPSELIMPLAGFMSTVQGGSHFNLWAAALAGGVGGTLGSVVSYEIGAVGGRPLLLRYGRYVLISEHDADRADLFFARHGDPTIFFTRLMPIIRTFISLPAGITRMNLGKFVVYTFVGSFLWCVILGYAGYTLGQHWQDVGGALRKYDVVIAVVVVALIAFFIYRHIRRPQTAK